MSWVIDESLNAGECAICHKPLSSNGYMMWCEIGLDHGLYWVIPPAPVPPISQRALKQGNYKTIYADPPWKESGGGVIKRGADRHYPLMSTEAIIALPVAWLAAPKAHLYLWATNNFLEDAFRVAKAWGFEYVTMVTWFKRGKVGLGQYYRGMTEHCLFCTRGTMPYRTIQGKQQTGVTGLFAERGEHSQKPAAMRQMIERVSYGPRIELFAREAAEGWDVWGNQSEWSVGIDEPLFAESDNTDQSRSGGGHSSQ